MKKIIVYADFDFLSAPQEVGTLGYEHVRGKDLFVFEYSRQWLKQHRKLAENQHFHQSHPEMEYACVG